MTHNGCALFRESRGHFTSAFVARHTPAKAACQNMETTKTTLTSATGSPARSSRSTRGPSMCNNL